MTETKPKQCPFCGTKEGFSVIQDKYTKVYYVGCTSLDCQAEGPVDVSKSGAIEKWDTRAEETCEWTYDDYHDCWETSCKNAWVMTDGGSPLDNEYKFCPACGNKIVAITPEPEPEEPEPMSELTTERNAVSWNID